MPHPHKKNAGEKAVSTMLHAKVMKEPTGRPNLQQAAAERLASLTSKKAKLVKRKS